MALLCELSVKQPPEVVSVCSKVVSPREGLTPPCEERPLILVQEMLRGLCHADDSIVAFEGEDPHPVSDVAVDDLYADHELALLCPRERERSVIHLVVRHRDAAAVAVCIDQAYSVVNNRMNEKIEASLSASEPSPES